MSLYKDIKESTLLTDSSNLNKDLEIILDETLKLCDVLMKEDQHVGFAWHLSKAILSYQMRSATTPKQESEESTGLFTVKEELLNKEGKPYASWYFDKDAYWVSKDLNEDFVYDKETAEKVAEKAKAHIRDDERISIIPTDYKPTEEELEKAIAELKSLEDDYEQSKDMSIMHDGSLDLLALNISDLKRRIKNLKEKLNK